MARKKSNQLRNKQRQLSTQKILIAAGAAILLIFSGVLIYLQVSVPQDSAAEQPFTVEPTSLPVALSQEKMAVEKIDTTAKAAAYKVAKPLSLTPKLPSR